MNISRTTGLPVNYTKLTSPSTNFASESTPQEAPTDSFSFSNHDNAGWKIAGMCVGLASVPLAIAAKKPALMLVGGAVGIGLMFGPDD